MRPSFAWVLPWLALTAFGEHRATISGLMPLDVPMRGWVDPGTLDLYRAKPTGRGPLVPLAISNAETPTTPQLAAAIYNYFSNPDQAPKTIQMQSPPPGAGPAQMVTISMGTPPPATGGVEGGAGGPPQPEVAPPAPQAELAQATPQRQVVAASVFAPSTLDPPQAAPRGRLLSSVGAPPSEPTIPGSGFSFVSRSIPRSNPTPDPVASTTPSVPREFRLDRGNVYSASFGPVIGNSDKRRLNPALVSAPGTSLVTFFAKDNEGNADRAAAYKLYGSSNRTISSMGGVVGQIDALPAGRYTLAFANHGWHGRQYVAGDAVLTGNNQDVQDLTSAINRARERGVIVERVHLGGCGTTGTCTDPNDVTQVIARNANVSVSGSTDVVYRDRNGYTADEDTRIRLVVPKPKPEPKPEETEEEEEEEKSPDPTATPTSTPTPTPTP